jgi:hypothetical protein
VDLGKADREIIADVWTSTAPWLTCLDLVERFPNRYGGHVHEVGARDFVADRLRRYGLTVALEEFPCQHWHPGRASLHAVADGRALIPIQCLNLPMNGTATVDAEVVWVEEGTQAQYASLGDRVRDRVVLVNSRCPAYSHRPRTCRREKYLQAVDAGAAGFIYMRHEGGLLPEVYSLSADGPAPVPGVSVTREAGSALLRYVRRGAGVRLDLENEITPAVSWNIVADITGPKDAPVVLVGAHYDTLVGCPGAIDDASGVAVMLEAARVLSQHRDSLRKTIRFVGFGLEEGGLLGARAYVGAHRERLGDVEFMMNIDGAAYGAPEKGVGLQGWPSLIPYFKGLVASMAEEMPVDVWVTPNSDMHQFMLAGVPCAWFFDMGMSLANLGWPHTGADTLDKLSPRGLRITALQLARLLLYMGATPMPPVTRSRQEVDQWLAEWNLTPRR